MKCLFCNQEFKLLAANAESLPPLAPIVCDQCGSVALWVKGSMRKLTDSEMRELRQSEAWRTIIAPVKKMVAANAN